MNAKYYSYSPPHKSNLSKATDNLLAALLRFPGEFPQHAKSLNPRHLEICGENGKTCAKILEVFTSKGTYNISSIQHATKRTDLFSFAAMYLDAGLDFYVELFNGEYQTAATVEAHTQAAAEILSTGIPAEGQNAFDIVCNYFALNQLKSDENWRERFTNEVEDKLNGIITPCFTMNPIPGFKAVFDRFDAGTVTVIAARPGMGKTQLVLNIMSGFEAQGAHGVIYSLEMPGVQLGRRLLSMKTRINYKSDWAGLSEDEKQRIRDARKEITEANYDFVANVTLSQLIADARIRHKQGQLDYLIVDHIGLVETGSKDIQQSLQQVTKRLKLLSIELNIPIIELSQLSRAVETRGGSKRPVLSDLRDSGTVEQDADNVIFIYRAEYYSILEDEQGRSLSGIAEIIVAKQREGEAPVTAIVGYHPILGFIFTEDEIRAKNRGEDLPGGGVSDNRFPESEHPANGGVNRKINENDIPF